VIHDAEIVLNQPQRPAPSQRAHPWSHDSPLAPPWACPSQSPPLDVQQSEKWISAALWLPVATVGSSLN